MFYDTSFPESQKTNFQIPDKILTPDYQKKSIQDNNKKGIIHNNLDSKGDLFHPDIEVK